MTAPFVPPARELESALAAARVENERLRAMLERIVRCDEGYHCPECMRNARKALSPPAAPGPATGGTT